MTHFQGPNILQKSSRFCFVEFVFSILIFCVCFTILSLIKVNAMEFETETVLRDLTGKSKSALSFLTFSGIGKISFNNTRDVFMSVNFVTVAKRKNCWYVRIAWWKDYLHRCSHEELGSFNCKRCQQITSEGLGFLIFITSPVGTVGGMSFLPTFWADSVRIYLTGGYFDCSMVLSESCTVRTYPDSFFSARCPRTDESAVLHSQIWSSQTIARQVDNLPGVVHKFV